MRPNRNVAIARIDGLNLRRIQSAQLLAGFFEHEFMLGPWHFVVAREELSVTPQCPPGIRGFRAAKGAPTFVSVLKRLQF